MSGNENGGRHGRSFEVIRGHSDREPETQCLVRPNRLVVHRDDLELVRPVLTARAKAGVVTSAFGFDVFELEAPATRPLGADREVPADTEAQSAEAGSAVQDALEAMDDHVGRVVKPRPPDRLPSPEDPIRPSRTPRYGPLTVMHVQEHGEGGPHGDPTPADPLPPLPTMVSGGSLPGQGVRVAVLDSGVNAAHPWFAGRVQARAGLDDDFPFSRDEDGHVPGSVGHGTFVAGCVLRCAPGATVIARKVLALDGSTDDLAVATALREVAQMTPRVDVVNMSFGGFTYNNAGLSMVPAALEELVRTNPDVVVVACAGNNSVKARFYPAAEQGVTGVGAVEATGERAGFSNYGEWVDAWAEGVDIEAPFVQWTEADGSPTPGTQPFARWSGTSFAAPLVAGMIARKIRPHGATGLVNPGPKAAQEVFADAGSPRADSGFFVKALFGSP